jgi:hypothetical protein
MKLKIVCFQGGGDTFRIHVSSMDVPPPIGCKKGIVVEYADETALIDKLLTVDLDPIILSRIAGSIAIAMILPGSHPSCDDIQLNETQWSAIVESAIEVYVV